MEGPIWYIDYKINLWEAKLICKKTKLYIEEIDVWNDKFYV